MEILGIVCGGLAGLVWLVTGAVKALAPATPFKQLRRVSGAPEWAVLALIGCGAAVQCVLGWAMALRLYPAIVFPCGLALLAVLAAWTLWTYRVKGVEDCGCYGALGAMDPRKSLALDAVYAALMAAGWRAPVSFRWTAAAEWQLLWEPGLVMVTAIAMSCWAFRRSMMDLLDLSPARVGKPWRAEWIEGYEQFDPEAERLVVILSRTCAACRDWIKPLNMVARAETLPHVAAAMAGDTEELAEFARNHGVDFPLLPMRQHVVDRLATGFPMMFEIRGGRVVSRQDTMPASLLERLKALRAQSGPRGLQSLMKRRDDEKSSG